MIFLFTDGSTARNPGPGGWAYYYVRDQKVRKGSGPALYVTNNQMELTAALRGLTDILSRRFDDRIILTSDSQYVVNGATKYLDRWRLNGWMTANNEAVSNKWLWLEMIDLMSYLDVTFCWVKGHSNQPQNEIVDKMARRQSRRVRDGIAYLSRSKSS